jgi:hypothetical protein
MAQDLTDLALQAAHAGFAGIMGNNRAQRVIADLDLIFLQAVGLDLPRHEITPGDLKLLLGRVAGEADDLHAVAQRARNGVEHVRGSNEYHPAKVKRDREIIVAERIVLLGIEDFQERRRRIALDAGAELVDLVEHMTQLRAPALRIA